MAQLNVRGNAMYDELCAELAVPFERCGTLVVAFCDAERSHLEELLQRGSENGVPGLRLVEHMELMHMEPNLNPQAVCALFAPTGGTIEPYELTIALAENAARNGVLFLFEHPVTSLQRTPDAWRIQAGDCSLTGRFVVNAAGLFADEINRMAGADAFDIHARRGEYLLLEDNPTYTVHRPIFQVPTSAGKGIVVSRTVDGTMIVGPTADDAGEKGNLGTTTDGLRRVLEGARKTIPALQTRTVITEFTGERAMIDGYDDFLVSPSSVPGFFNVAGIKSPGLTAAPAIAEKLVAQLGEGGLHLTTRSDFCPCNEHVPLFRECAPEQQQAMIVADARYGRIVCRCETVTEGDIMQAIHRPAGARTVDGVKFRTRAGMGRCQGGFCGPRALEILARELHETPLQVTKCGKGSEILVGRLRPEEAEDV